MPTRPAKPRRVLERPLMADHDHAATPRSDLPPPGGRTNAVGGGKTTVYMLRWVNTRGEKGPWSEAATVAA